MSADAIMRVSVVVERRASTNAWADVVWHPVGVVPAIAGEAGDRLAESDGVVQFHAGTFDLELFRRETEGYLSNLSQIPPVVFVVLRKAEDGPLDYMPFLVTACPWEAMGYTQGGDDIVESVPMTPEIRAWLGEFLALHHADEPFLKRRNRRHDDVAEDLS